MCRHLTESSEYNSEHQHREDGSNDRPGYPHHSLLVSDEDVSPCEEIEQLPIPPQIAPIMTFPSSSLNYQIVHELYRSDLSSLASQMALLETVDQTARFETQQPHLRNELVSALITAQVSPLTSHGEYTILDSVKNQTRILGRTSWDSCCYCDIVQEAM